MRRRGLLGAPLLALSPSLARAASSPAPAPGMKLGCQSGPTDEKRLRFFARHGVKNICGDLRDRKVKGPYTRPELEELRDLCARHGISLDMVRLPFLRPTYIDRASRPAIMLGQSPER